MMKNTSELLTEAQEIYKKKNDARLRKWTEVFNVNDNVYLRVERKDPNESWQMLAPVAEEP